MLWWRCLDEAIYTAYQMGLSVNNGKVGVKRDSSDAWTRDGSQDNICQRPYRSEYTGERLVEGPFWISFCCCCEFVKYGSATCTQIIEGQDLLMMTESQLWDPTVTRKIPGLVFL